MREWNTEPYESYEKQRKELVEITNINYVIFWITILIAFSCGLFLGVIVS